MTRQSTDKREPYLYGLVLAGGKSVRMGKDKGMISWHGRPQRYYLADLLRRFCREVYISCRPEQVSSVKAGYDTLSDTENDGGQYGAILNALVRYPEAAWLVVACDMPLLDAGNLSRLVDNRGAAKLATAFVNEQGLPEPLAAIWEPASRERLEAYRAKGISCPRKALIAMGESVKHVTPLRQEAVMNVNTPAEADMARRILTVQEVH